MHIGFDNTSRLCRNVYYFEYKGIRYKLIQNNTRKWQDVLLTIISGGNNKKLQDKAYITASEFLSALSWENGSRTKLENIGGFGVYGNCTLKKAKCRCFSFPEVPFGGNIQGYNISKIPKIETNEQRNALILFREASSSNNQFLSFLFYWQVLEIGKKDAVGWINKTYRKNRNGIRLSTDEISKLPLNNKKLGNYFLDDCRNVIAHIVKRKPGLTTIQLDNPDDNLRIKMSTYVIEEFARFYIKSELNLTKNMYLVRKNGKGFPVYMDEDDTKKCSCPLAYKDRPQKIRY